jgi:hypothetical protein
VNSEIEKEPALIGIFLNEINEFGLVGQELLCGKLFDALVKLNKEYTGQVQR